MSSRRFSIDEKIQSFLMHQSNITMKFSLAKQQVDDDLVSFEKHVTSLIEDAELLGEQSCEGLKSLRATADHLVKFSSDVRKTSPGLYNPCPKCASNGGQNSESTASRVCETEAGRANQFPEE
jgi:hypothetical protein